MPHRFSLAAAVSIVILLAAAPARAQLLVEPLEATGRHTHTLAGVFGQPSVALEEDSTTTPRRFGNSNSSSLSFGLSNAAIRAESGYEATFFYQFPEGNINTARAVGSAEVRVQTGDGLDLSASAASVTSISFRVTEPVVCTVSGSLAITDASGIGAGLGLVGVHADLNLGPFNQNQWSLDLIEFAPDTMTLSWFDVLFPGDYTLLVSAHADAGSSAAAADWHARATYDVRFDFAPIPSPGITTPLAAAGLLAARRRRPRAC